MAKLQMYIRENKLMTKVHIFKSGEEHSPILVPAIFDTGSDITGVSKNLIMQMGLYSCDRYDMITLNGKISARMYEDVVIGMLFPMEEQDYYHQINIPRTVSEINVSENSDFQVIIGMDIITCGTLVISHDKFTFDLQST